MSRRNKGRKGDRGEVRESVRRLFVELPKDFHVKLEGRWKDVRDVFAKARFLEDDDGVRVTVYFEGQEFSGGRRNIGLKYISFSDADGLERLGVICLALANLLRGAMNSRELLERLRNLPTEVSRKYASGLVVLRENASAFRDGRWRRSG